MRRYGALSPLTCFAAIAALGMIATPAKASQVLEVAGDRARVVEDPYLPPRVLTDLPAPVGPHADERPPGPAGPPAHAAGGPSIYGALQRAVAAGRLTPQAAGAYIVVYQRARKVRRRLHGKRRKELGSVIGTLERTARSRRLSAGRMPALFLQLHRNTSFWRSHRFPASGSRVSFAGSPVIFQYYPKRGLQIQPLANFARANALYNGCARPHRRTPRCNRESLRGTLDWLLAIAAERGGFTAWEYYFSFGGGRPPWVSGISQGTAVQALARGTRLLGDGAYLGAARSALGAFERRWPTGVRAGSRGGNHYLLYSFAPRLRVLNGFAQSLNGLFDLAKISGDPRAQRLFAAGDRALRRELPRYRTRHWSLYSLGGARADVRYHRANRDFVRSLCDRTKARAYCRTARRFTRQLRSPRIVRKYSGKGKRHARQRVIQAQPAPPPAPPAAPAPDPLKLGVRVSVRVEADGRRRLVFDIVPPG